PAKRFLEEFARLESFSPSPRERGEGRGEGRAGAAISTVESCRAALANAQRDLDFIRLDAKAFAQAPKDSIDYAVMEKTDKAALVPMDAGWDDVGAWTYLSKLPKDARGNYLHGDVMV